MKRSYIIVFFLGISSNLIYSQSDEVVYQVDSSNVKVVNDKFYRVHNESWFRKGSKTRIDYADSTNVKYTQLQLSDIHFEQTKSKILSQSFKKLDILYDILNRNKYFKIRINGHTDKIGHSRKNLRLSKKRAKAIKLYLIKKGIDKSRVETHGYGDRHPICKSPCSENRRVEFKLSQIASL